MRARQLPGREELRDHQRNARAVVDRQRHRRSALEVGEEVTRSSVQLNQSTSMQTLIKLVPLLAIAVMLHAAPQTVVNNSVWNDTSGNEILAQGGSMIQIGS